MRSVKRARKPSTVKGRGSDSDGLALESLAGLKRLKASRQVVLGARGEHGLLA